MLIVRFRKYARDLEKHESKCLDSDRSILLGEVLNLLS
jgi:hypothetical protein